MGLKDGEPQLPRGVIFGQKLMLTLRKLSAIGARSDFDDLARPFRAVAADLESGEPVVLKSGSLALAMRASMSVPGVFPPVDYDGRLLIDGGVANNLPIDVARALGAEIVIAVNVQTNPRPRKELQSRSVDAPVISSIRIDNDTPLADEVLRSRLRARVGEPLVLNELEQDISRIYGLGHFDTVDYQLVGRRHAGILVVTARRKGTSLNNLRFGLNLESDFVGESAFNIGLNYDITAVNALGAEWRSEIVFGDRLKLATEFYQPLDYSSQWFVEPQAAYEEEDVALFEDGNRLAEFRVKTALAGVDVGREFGSCCEGRLGFRIGRGEVEPTSGTLGLPADKFDIGLFVVSVTHDTLDNVRFPRQGMFASVAYADFNEALGADNTSRLVSLGVLVVRSWGPNTVLGQLSLGVNVDEGAQVQDLFSLGGFLNLSGFTQNELSGEHAVLTSLAFYRRIGGGGLKVLDIPVYAGGSIEYGGVFTEIGNFASDEGIAAGSLFLGADTPIGPLYIGYGMAEGGNRAAYLFLGQTF